MGPLGYNPIINVYRWMATKVRSTDERPLKFDILRVYQKLFKRIEHREFWLLSLSIFLKYYFLDRIHPNDDRYWKRILKENSESIGWVKPLVEIDNGLLKLPIVRRMAWTILIYGEK